ncbi:MAG: hypothetical protein R3281_05330 [Balneolaceae bacterium]|nr:hypothetical protein [Balneolaceae bacterium]
MNRAGFQQIFLLSILLLMGTATAGAQQDQAQSSLLPEIDPQDIEIRSEFTARFPGLRRQPILGFTPEPSIYQVDPDRMPFMESQEEVVANLPITDLSRPDPPPYQPLSYEPEINAYGRLGVGSFVSPEAEFWGINRFSKNSYISGRLDYHSTNGHLDTENSSFRFFDLDAEYATKLGRQTTVSINAGAENSFNRMFWLDGAETLPIQIPAGPRKTYSGVNIGADLSRHTNSIEGWDGSLAFRRFDMEMDAGDIGGDAAESIFGASFRNEWAGGRLQETIALRLSGRGGSYELSSQADSQNWLTVQAGGEYQRLLDYSTQLSADLGVVYTSNAFEDKVYPGFTFSAKHWIQDNLTVNGQLSGTPKLQSIEQLNNLNRFLNHQSPLRHTYTVEAAGQMNLEYYRGSSIYAKVSFMQAQNYAYFDRAPLPVNTTGSAVPEGYYQVNYMDANKIKGELGATHQLVPEKLWIDAAFYVQNPKLDDGNDIPFEETWGVNSGFSAKLFSKLRIEAWADYVSERNTLSSGSTEKIDGFLLLGGRVEIDITDRIGVYAKMLNLLSQEYQVWQGYEERPFQAYGGVTVKLN